MNGTKTLSMVAVPDEAETRALGADITAQLANLPTAIADQATYIRAKESLPLLKRAEDKVVGFFRDMKKAASDAHRTICAKEKEQLDPIARARQHVSGLIYGWERKQERQRREREREAAEAERRRQEVEALEAAADLQAQGAIEMAEQVIEQAIAAPAPVVALPSTNVTVSGVSTVANWQWRFTGCATGVEWDKLAVADQQRIMTLLPAEYHRPDEKAIGKVVKALKGGTRIAGIEAFDAGTVRVRG